LAKLIREKAERSKERRLFATKIGAALPWTVAYGIS
jgi:hypothetical protein